MFSFFNVVAVTAVLLPVSAAQCSNGLCADETSLLQVEKSVLLGNERPELEKTVLLEKNVLIAKELSDKGNKKEEAKEVPIEAHGETHSDKAHWSTYSKFMNQVHLEALSPKEKPSLAEIDAKPGRRNKQSPQQVQYVPVQMVTTGSSGAASYVASPSQHILPATGSSYTAGYPTAGATVMGSMQGLMPQATDYHYNQVSIQTQVSPGGGNEDPRKAAARAAEAEEKAERAMEDAVWKAQQEERAAMFASKRAAALRAAAEKAAAAENQAARSQIAAADALENSAVRQAATDRSHARVAAYKSIVQQATAYQAAADQTFAAQRAAAARSAAQTAANGLHSMQDDTQSSDNLFNDRDSRKYDRHRYHDAMDNIEYDRDRFRDEDEDEDYDLDEDEDYRGHYQDHGGYGGSGGRGGRRHGRRHSQQAAAAPAAAGCAMGDIVSATFAGDGRQYNAKVAAANPDGSYTVSWLDGWYPEGTTVPAAQVYKQGMPCGAAAGGMPGAAPMAGGMPMA